MQWRVEVADVLDWARTYSGPPFHALLCDPPYELGFMNKAFDRTGISFRAETWAALAAHLHPGAFLFVFASTRGQHRVGCALEDARLRLHPVIGWLCGSSFPKATRIDTAVDRAAGAPRRKQLIPTKANNRLEQAGPIACGASGFTDVSEAVTPLARAWAGHRYGGQILRNNLEIILVAQKPYAGKPVESITRTGAGALNVDAARIGHANANDLAESQAKTGRWPSNFAVLHSPECQRIGMRKVDVAPIGTSDRNSRLVEEYWSQGGGGFKVGRSVASHADADGTEAVAEWRCADDCAVAALDRQSGLSGGGQFSQSGKRVMRDSPIYGKPNTTRNAPDNYGDTGGASRFYFTADWSLDIAERIAAADPITYCAKASRRERDAGLDGMPVRNVHPTVKALTLCRHLATLLLPPPEYAPRRLLVPFAGSGSEMCAALLAGWDEICGIEMDAEYVAIAERRLAFWHDAGNAVLDDMDAAARHAERREMERNGQQRLFDG